MNKALQDRIINLPEYQELLRRRRQLNRPLVIVMLVAYFGFVLALAFFPQFLSYRIGEGVTTLGLCLGLALIFLTFLITGIFIQRTDTIISDLLERIQKKVIGG